MRLLASPTYAAVLSTLASPAAADWQWTRWGMSPDEVAAAFEEAVKKIVQAPKADEKDAEG